MYDFLLGGMWIWFNWINCVIFYDGLRSPFKLATPLLSSVLSSLPYSLSCSLLVQPLVQPLVQSLVQPLEQPPHALAISCTRHLMHSTITCTRHHMLYPTTEFYCIYLASNRFLLQIGGSDSKQPSDRLASYCLHR